jgi:uncharacterized protein (TIGR02145 family)
MNYFPTFLSILFFTLLNFSANAQTVTDFDGNVYPTVEIGGREWMAADLRTKHFSNGDPIPEVKDNSEWEAVEEPAMCYYDNDSVANASVFGALYNGFVAVDDRNACPLDWHVATHSDWNRMTYSLDTLVDTLSPAGFTGSTIDFQLKVSDPDMWWGPFNGYNSSGFTAVPGGVRDGNGGGFGSLHFAADWWTSTGEAGGGYIRWLSSEQAGIKAEMRNIKHGYSIRCVRNPGTTSAQPVEKKTGFILFPNPTHGDITIQLEQTGVADVLIYSLRGELVYGSQINDTFSRLELSHLPSGVYIVKVGNGDFCKTERLLVK